MDIVVGWQASWWIAPEAKSKRVSMDATQRWTVRRSREIPLGWRSLPTTQPLRRLIMPRFCQAVAVDHLLNF